MENEWEKALPFVPGERVYVVHEQPDPVQVLPKEIRSITIGRAHDRISFMNGTQFTVWDKDWNFAMQRIFRDRAAANTVAMERFKAACDAAEMEEKRRKKVTEIRKQAQYGSA
jgi:hypothetical protein